MKQIRISCNQMMEAAIIFYLLAVIISPSTSGSFVRAARVVLVLAFIACLLIANKLVLIRSDYIKWALLFFTYCTIGLLWASYPAAARSQLLTLAYVFIADLIILYYLYRNPDRLGMIIDVLIIGSILSNFYIYLMNGFTAFLVSDTLKDGTNSNLYGLHSAFSVVLSLIRMRQINGERIRRRWYVLAVLLSLIFVFLSGSRKAYFYLLIPIGVLVILQSRSPLKVAKRILLVCVLVGLGYFAIMYVPPLYKFIGESIQSMLAGLMGGNTDTSVSARMNFIRFGLQKFRQNPVFGYGLNGFSHLYKEISYSGTGHYAHNNYVELLVDCGLIGTVIYYIMPISALLRLLHRWLKGNNTELSSAYIGLLIAILICDYGQVSYYLPYIQLILMLCFMSAEEKVRVQYDS